MRVRILHVLDNIGMGGLQNGLANIIARLDLDRFEHVICGIRPVEEVHVQPFPPGRFRLVELVGNRNPSRFQIGALLKTIRKVKPDIVHSRNWAAIEAVIAGRMTGCHVIHSEHGFDSREEPWHRIRFRRLAFELAHRVVSVSYQLRDTHAARTGFPAKRIQVIHNGVDATRFRADKASRAKARQELGLADDDFCIGCVGNLTAVKDHLTVLRALEMVDSHWRNWHLVLIGDGPKLADLQSFIANCPGWNKRISFLGRCQRVPEMLNAFDVYVLSSLTEGICNSLLEAMAAGLPVIATDTGGNPEVVVDGESGLLFPVGDAQKLAELVMRLRDETNMRSSLAKAAERRMHEEFSMNAMIRQYDDLYRRSADSAGVESAQVALLPK